MDSCAVQPRTRPTTILDLPAEIKLQIFMTPLSGPWVWALALSCKAFQTIYRNHEAQIMVAEREAWKFEYPCDGRPEWINVSYHGGSIVWGANPEAAVHRYFQSTRAFERYRNYIFEKLEVGWSFSDLNARREYWESIGLPNSS